MENQNQVEKIFSESKTAVEFAKGYVQYLNKVLNDINPDEIGRFIDSIYAARNRGSYIFFIGNGGSAATASHFANDMGIGTRSWKKPFRAVSLTDNVAAMTAIGNDYGYEEIFVQQLMNMGVKKDDMVVAISASGNSPNVIKAIEYAKSKGAITFGLTGFSGGKLREVAQYAVHVPSNRGEYGPVEDAHMVLDHLAFAFLANMVKKEEA